MPKVNQSQATSKMTELAYTAPTAIATPDESNELSDSELEVVAGGAPGKDSGLGLLMEWTGHRDPDLDCPLYFVCPFEDEEP